MKRLTNKRGRIIERTMIGVGVVLAAIAPGQSNDDRPPDPSGKALENSFEVPISDAIRKLVEESVQDTRSDDFKKRVSEAQAQIRQGMEAEGVVIVKDAPKTGPQDGLAEGDRLYVFISSSLPDRTVRNYVHDLARIPGAQAVLRGFVGGARTIKPTAEYVARVLREDPGCQGAQCAMRDVSVIIDPLLFRRFGVNRVPAVVFASGAKQQGDCSEGVEENLTIAGYGMVYGDASLAYALHSIGDETGLPGIDKILRQLPEAGG